MSCFQDKLERFLHNEKYCVVVLLWNSVILSIHEQSVIEPIMQ
jgi:hypothetical protein